MMIFTKKSITYAISLLSLFALTACGGPGDNEDPHAGPYLELPEGGGMDFALEVGESDAASFEIMNTGREDTPIEVDNFDADWLTISPTDGEIPAGESLEFDVEVTCPDEDGGYNQNLELISDDPVSPHRFVISMHCSPLARGELQLVVEGLPGHIEPSIYVEPSSGEHRWLVAPDGHIDELEPGEYHVDPEAEVDDGTTYVADPFDVTVVSAEETTATVTYTEQ